MTSSRPISLLSLALLTLALLPLCLPRPALAQAEAGAPKVTCTWGTPEPGEAIQGCGVPRGLHVEPPAGAEALMFSREDNPTLTRYLYRGRAVGAPSKPFQRMVNVGRTDLVLCPSDFQKARILAFRVMKGQVIASRPTCEVTLPGAAPEPGADAGTSAAPGMATEPDMAAVPLPATRQGPRSVTDAIEAENPVRQRDLVQLRRAIKMDSLARLLGLLGLVFGVLALVGVVLLALSLRQRVQRLERDMDRSRASDA